MTIRFYAVCIALSTMAAQAAQMTVPASAQERPMVIHYYAQPQPKSTLKNALIVTGVCAVGYGLYDYFFSNGRKLNALLKAVTKLKDHVTEKADEIKTTVKEDGNLTRRDIAELHAEIRELREELRGKKKPSNGRALTNKRKI